MDRNLLLGLVFAFFALLVALMALGWYLRRRRQRGIPLLYAVPVALGQPTAVFDGFYVATTYADQPLNRVAVRGLGFRARTSISIFESGVLLGLAGGTDVFIPRSSVRDVARSTVAIDRVVEKDGLVELRWTLGATVGSATVGGTPAGGTPPAADSTADATAPAETLDIDSYFRVSEPQLLLTALSPLAPSTGRQ